MGYQCSTTYLLWIVKGVLKNGRIQHTIHLRVKAHRVPFGDNRRFQLLEQIKNALDAADIGIPFPQMDIHVKELPLNK